MKEKANSFINGLISFVFTILIVALIGFTIWFCLDYFEIVDLSEKTSIISIIGKYDTYVVKGMQTTELRDETIVQPRKRKININDTTNDGDENDIEDPLSRLNPTHGQGSGSGSYEINSSGYYYSQLNEYSKYIYDELYSNYENLKSGTYTIDFGNYFNDLLHKDNGENILNDSFQLALNSLTFDKPELYFINITKMYLFSEKTSFAGIVRYKHSIGPAKDQNYLSDSFEDENGAREKIAIVEQKVSEVIEEANKKESDVEKIEYVHNYILYNCEYNSTKDYQNIYNAYGVICDGRAVCEGYAKALKLFLDKLNIESIIVCGTGTNSGGQVEDHAWNYVLVDGLWYAVDSTWDDPIVIGATMASYNIMHKYFLVGSDVISKDHVPNGVLISSLIEPFAFSYPTLSINDYKGR